MNILFIGDIVSKPGRTVLEKHLKNLQIEHEIDFTIVNAENAAHGKGLTPKIFNQIINFGVDVITLGNHAYAKEEIFQIIDDQQIVRPINLTTSKMGKGYRIYDVLDKKVLVGNICGEAFMHNVDPNPFIATQQFIDADAHIKIIDLHGEATAEKVAYMHYFKNDLTAILGTHTHVQTADEDIFNGCAYISDVGMSGPYESVIGRDIDEVVSRYVENKQTYNTVSKNEAVLCGVVIKIDDKSNRAVNIERIQIRP